MLPVTWQHDLSVAVLGLACHFSWQAFMQASQIGNIGQPSVMFFSWSCSRQTESQWTQYNRNGRRYYLFSTIVLRTLLDCNIQSQFLIHKSSSVFELQSGVWRDVCGMRKGREKKSDEWKHMNTYLTQWSITVRVYRPCLVLTLWREKVLVRTSERGLGMELLLWCRTASLRSLCIVRLSPFSSTLLVIAIAYIVYVHTYQDHC